ncbi:hypothetical protein BDB01DRAFT_791149 [Pilobolus umbonatus]|nr:hypothetical protein BDB01DRAFT_791149 [Pilobolus umbonatus]
MERNLSFMRASLLASITPLVSTDIVQIPGLLSTSQLATVAMSTEYYGDQILTEDIGKIENDLLDSVLVLNKKISHQLGLIVNARQSSEILIRQVNSLSHNEEKPTVVTVEWKLRQPFQINIIREEETADVSLLSETEWLQKELYGVENMMLDEFNDHAQELIELIMENIALKMFL